MKQPFTLIELLVVIAVIAILAAILMPVYAFARQAALSIGNSLNKLAMAFGRQAKFYKNYLICLARLLQKLLKAEMPEHSEVPRITLGATSLYTSCRQLGDMHA